MVPLFFILSIFGIIPSILGQTCTNGFVPFPNGCAPCPQTCGGANDVCTAVCRPCECPSPKVVDQNGNCIAKSECPVISKTCPVGEMLYSSGCAPCDNLCPNIYDALYRCTKDCQINVCRCQPGFVRNAKNVCVAEENCPQMCTVVDEIYYSNICLAQPPCGPPITCNDFFKYTGEPSLCLMMICVLRQICACKPGYLKNDNGICIPISECPKPSCNPGETFYIDCAPCDKTCPNIFNPKYTCTYECRINSCRCSEGHYRDQNDVCVPEASCPKLCSGENEVYYNGTDCLPCERTCNNWFRKDPSCIVAVCLRNMCICKPGFIRKNDVCVPIEECPAVCGPGEHFYGLEQCAPCEGGCPKDPLCTRECKSNICACKVGYKRINSTTCAPNC